ncbi:MAG: hypothetical protein MUE75_06530 [Algoriphagus sp.]|nr:hypothetical protein [Algoriphagus sp.]
MQAFILELKSRNEALFYFGLSCLLASLVFLMLTRITSMQVYQVNAWYKPFKFAFSTFTFAWAMAWYCAYLPLFEVDKFNLVVIVLLSFEIVYIAVMASQGKMSHFNVSTPFYSAMYSLMAFAASAVTLYTAYIGLLFFTSEIMPLPDYYLWGIRLGILVFVIFSFEGFLMGSRLNHSVGLENDNSDLFVLGWSRLVGDLRVSHFIGMHALQILPLLSFFLLKSSRLTLIGGLLYLLLAGFTLKQALSGKPFLPLKNKPTHSLNS